MPFDQQSQKLRLLRRQVIRRAPRRPEVTEQPYDAARNLRRHRRAPIHRLPKRFDQTGGRRVLEQVPRRASAQGVEDAIVVVVDRERQDRHRGIALPKLANAVDPRHAWQPEVGEHEVRLDPADVRQRLFHRPVLARAREIRRAVDEGAEAFPNLALVLDDRHSHFHRGTEEQIGRALSPTYRGRSPGGCVGIVARTRVPTPGADVTSSAPPRRSARRVMLDSPSPSWAAARGSKPRPSSATSIASDRLWTATSIDTLEHPAWRAALLIASLKMRKAPRRTAAPSARSCSSGAWKFTTTPRVVNSSSAWRRMRRTRSSR